MQVIWEKKKQTKKNRRSSLLDDYYYQFPSSVANQNAGFALVHYLGDTKSYFLVFIIDVAFLVFLSVDMDVFRECV